MASNDIEKVTSTVGRKKETRYRYKGKLYTSEKAAQTALDKDRQKDRDTDGIKPAIRTAGPRAPGTKGFEYRGKFFESKRDAEKAQAEFRSTRPWVTGTSGSTTPGPGFGLREYEAKAVAPLLAPIDRNNRDQVIWRQTELKNLGADIVVDGVWGPVTEWYEAMANNGDLKPPPTPQAPAQQRQPIRGGGGVVGGSSGSGGGVAGPAATFVAEEPKGPPAASLSPADLKMRVLVELPQAAAFLNIPELVPLIQQRLDKTISDQEFAVGVQQTEWYRKTPLKTRAWMGLYAVDPASAERAIKEEAATYKKTLSDYAVTLADVTVEQWARKVLSGEVEAAAFEGYVKEQAKSMFPTLAAAIDSGITVRQYAEPYAQTAARRLGVAPESINFSDEKWRRALVRIDPKTGDRVSMNLDEWESEIRSNPIYEWDRTQDARSEAAQFTRQLAEMFGRV